MLAFILIVRAHQSPSAPLQNGSLKCRQIDFVKRTVIHHYIDGTSPLLLIIQCIVFHTSSYTVRLHSLNVRHRQTGSQIRVFAHILEVTSVQRRTVDIYTRSQEDIFLTITCFRPDSLSISISHIRVERSSQTSQSRKCRTRVGSPVCPIKVSPKHLGSHSVGSVAHPQFRYSQTGTTCRAEIGLCMNHSHFLFQRHTRKRIFHPLFDCFVFIQIDRSSSPPTLLCKKGQAGYTVQAKTKESFLYLRSHCIILLLLVRKPMSR